MTYSLIIYQCTIYMSYSVAHTTEINTSYPNIIYQHLVKANWAQAALHNVCNRTCCHNCQKTFKTPLVYSTVFAENKIWTRAIFIHTATELLLV